MESTGIELSMQDGRMQGMPVNHSTILEFCRRKNKQIVSLQKTLFKHKHFYKYALETLNDNGHRTIADSSQTYFGNILR